MKMELIEGPETSAISTQTPGNYPKENMLHIEHGESLKSRILTVVFQKYNIWTNGIHYNCCEWNCGVNSPSVYADCDFLKPLRSRDSNFR